MRVEPDGRRFYTSEDVDHGKVRDAMKLVGDHMTQARLDDMRAHDEHPCSGTDARTRLRCNATAVGFYQNGHRCELHTPAAEAGRAETVTRCNAPLRCYCPKHANVDDAHEQNERAREQLSQRELAWINAVKSDVLQLARLRVPFTLAELAEHLPPARSAERPIVEQSLLALLTEGVERGLIVKHPHSNEWKGAAQ